MHWGPGTHTVQRADGTTDMQAHCWVEYPARATKPLHWRWKPACAKFAPDLLKYPRVFAETALNDRIHPTSGRLISAVQIATAEEHK
jgi:hypothetical protein